MKQRLLHALREHGLLEPTDAVHYLVHRAASAGGNRRFVRRNPDYPVPPAKLAFESYGHTSWDEYRRTGEAHASVIADLVRGHARGGDPLRVLEWGCGAGRIIRHLASAGLGAGARLFGVDVDGAAIEWCGRRLPGIRFQRCGPRPPLAFENCSFDVVYHYSVWTHLSEDSVRAWVRELARILKLQGIMIGTTHGEHYTGLLLPHELERYRAGYPVTRAGFAEGRKYYLSFHPPAYVTKILQGSFQTTRHLPACPERGVPQDLWIASGSLSSCGPVTAR